MAIEASRTASHPFLRALFPEHRSIVLQGAEEQQFAAGEILFREGHPANRLYLIEEGEVALETHVPGKGDVAMATIPAGKPLGWSWLVPPYVWHFQAQAVQPTRALVLNGGHLLVASEQNHFLGYELMRNISKVVLDVVRLTHERWLQTGHVVGARPVDAPSGPALDRSGSVETRMAQHPFFHQIHPAYLASLAPLALNRDFKAGQLVFNAGEPADGLYIVEAGRVSLEATVGREKIPVQCVGVGDSFGWSSFCEPYEWRFDGRALEPCSTLFFKAADVRERCAADYHLGYELTKRITRMMLQRLQSTRNRIWQALHG
jgi:CRP/FNR family transcriptional regulator, cyclic AMP receptor protein